jgi:hypothetical protein
LVLKVNSSRLRSVSAAPKLAITMMMMDPPLARRRPNSTASLTSASTPVSTIARTAANGSDQPNENGPMAEVRLLER